MDSDESSSQGGNLFDHYYENVSDKAELSRRTIKTKIPNGQAAFFTLITRLGVPVLNKSSNKSGGQDHLFVSLGASYRVTQALFALSDSRRSTINIAKGDSGKLEAAVGKQRYVTKRIVSDTTSMTTDGQHLAAIANEVRILANKTLKESKNLVKLLCVAWDEIPTLGRHWPRLLLEAADYGNLGDFLSVSSDAKNWDVKIVVILDVMAGLDALHNHGVAHCDLKLENVLVFRTAKKDDHPLIVTYQAKICDFGFSVIMTDYEEDATFSERLGTEPWSSPELSFGTQIKIKDLPQSDIYSLGLLSSRVFMNGGNPFGDLTHDEIRALKRHEEGNSTLLHDTITNAIFSQVTYTESRSALIQKHLLMTLGLLPGHRCPLNLLGAELILLGYAFRDHEKPFDDQSPKNGAASGPGVAAPEDSQIIDAAASTSTPIKRRFQNALGYSLATFSTPFRLLRRWVGWITTWLLWLAGKSLASLTSGLFRDPLEDPIKPKEIHIEPIAPLSSILSFGESDNEVEHKIMEDIPDFENSRKFTHTALSTSVAKEIIQNLFQIAEGPETSGSMRKAEAAYQLSVVYFEGISLPVDPEKGLQWLETAALGGSKKALTSSPNLFASTGRSMPSELSIAYDSAFLDLAKHELHWSSSSVFNGQLAQYEAFLALQRWVKIAPRELDEYLLSPECSLMREAVLSICLIERGIQKTEEPFDFRLLEGYNPSASEKFDTSNKSIFIKSVRQYRCLQRTDISSMTLLQRAAARGDLELIKTLVLDLEASIEACGLLPGLTPLWISCFNGYIDVVSFLVQQGAMPTCRDSISGRTILHFLNQFRNLEHVAHILEIGLKAGLSLEEKDEHGNTPLISTFIGWDFSNGMATKFLLDVGADVLVQSKNGWTPMCAAFKSLDVETSQAIANKYRASSLRSAGRLETPTISIEDDKVAAFGILCSQNPFYRRRVGGEETFKKLQMMVELVLDEGMVSAFRRAELSRGSNPLVGVSYMGHDDLVAAVLESIYCPGLDEVDETNSMSALHWSVERGRFVSAMKLLSLGANPLLQDKEGLNVFHRAARFSPSLLLQILEKIDSAHISKPAGHDVRSILAMATPEGYTPFMLAVIEGSTEHLKVAETLRKRYRIDYDSYSLQKNGTETKSTLMAYLVNCSIVSNIFTLEQIEYVLNIDPGPKFKGDTSGDTLLHYAVGGWQYADISSNQVGYAVLRLLLRKFPGRAHLDVINDQGYTPIHNAVYYANVVALEIIADHLASLGQELDPNFAGPGAPPPINGVGQVRKNLRLKEEDQPHLYAILKKNTAKTYALIRNLGGCFVSEQEGAMVCIIGRVQNELTKGRLLRFLEASRRAFGVEWEFIEADVPSSVSGTEQASFAVELCWAFDHFVLRARPMLTQDMGLYIEERAKARFKITKGEREFPWMETEYKQVIWGYQVRWTRRGRTWTIEERQELVRRIENAWLAMFPEGHATRIVVPTRAI